MRRILYKLSQVHYRSLAGRILRFPLRLIPSTTKVKILGGKLKGKQWIVGAGSHNYWLGGYEYYKQVLLENIIKRNYIVYDIGAHVGFYTLLASVLVGEGGKVYAFEPNPRNLFYLKKHIQLNKVENVFVIDAAVLDKDGWCYFDIKRRHDLGRVAENEYEGVKVRSVCLDTLILKKQFPPPNLVKMDVEGAELLVLRGSENVLKKFKPILVIDLHGEDNRRKCMDYLTSIGYCLYPVETEDIENSWEVLAVYSMSNKVSLSE